MFDEKDREELLAVFDDLTQMARNSLENDVFVPASITKNSKRVGVEINFHYIYPLNPIHPQHNASDGGEAEDPETEHGLQESAILDQMQRLKNTGSYDDYTLEQLREKAIDILEDDIPF